MKTTAIKTQELETEIDIALFYVRVNDDDDHLVRLTNGNTIKIRTTCKPHGTFVVFENGNLRFTKPVKIVEDAKQKN